MSEHSWKDVQQETQTNIIFYSNTNKYIKGLLHQVLLIGLVCTEILGNSHVYKKSFILMSWKLPYSFWKNGNFELGPSMAPVMDNQEPYTCISLTFIFLNCKYSTSCIKTFNAQELF